MTRSKILLALAIAVCAVATTAAPASAFFHSSSYPAKEHGQGLEQKLTVTGGALKCEEVHLFSTGQAKEDSSQQKLAANFVKCFTTLPAEAEAKVNTNQCAFNFHQAKTALEGTISIECLGGAGPITATAEKIGCIITITPTNNQNLTKWKGENSGTKGVKRVVNATTAITGLTYTVNPGCEAVGITGGKTGAFSGTATLESQKDVDGAQVDFELV